MSVVTVFENCQLVVENLEFPDGRKGKSLTIIDPESKLVFRYPMSDKQSEQVSAQLISGRVAIPSAIEAESVKRMAQHPANGKPAGGNLPLT